MLSAIRLFNRDLRNVAGGSKHKIWMLNSVFTTVGHADNKRPKRRVA